MDASRFYRGYWKHSGTSRSMTAGEKDHDDLLFLLFVSRIIRVKHLTRQLNLLQLLLGWFDADQINFSKHMES